MNNFLFCFFFVPAGLDGPDRKEPPTLPPPPLKTVDLRSRDALRMRVDRTVKGIRKNGMTLPSKTLFFTCKVDRFFSLSAITVDPEGS